MRLRWTTDAALDLEEISDFTHKRFPEHAHLTVKAIYKAAVALRNMPYKGRPGPLSTRELVMNGFPYVITYRVDMGSVHLLKIRHTSRDLS